MATWKRIRHSDLVPGSQRTLIYSHRVSSERRTLGVLCLCFCLEDECASIFSGLHSEADWTVLSLLDAGGEVIFSSDAYQVPAGVPAGSRTDVGHPAG